MSLLDALKEFSEGKIDSRQLEYLDQDRIIKVSRVNSENLGKSLVTLTFDRDDYLELFVNKDEDTNNSYLLNIVFSNYSSGDYVFVDSYSMQDDWGEGYLIRYFSEENKTKFEELLRQVNPTLYSEYLKDENNRQVFKYMQDTFDREISEIVYDYSAKFDDALVGGLRQYLDNKFCKQFDDYGIYEKTCAYKYFTTVNLLISFWKKTNSGKDDTLLEVLKKFVKDNDLGLDEDLYEDYYAYYDDRYFDNEGFQREVSRQLDKIEEKIEEMNEDGELTKNAEVYKQLDKLGIQFGNWTKIPSRKNFGKESNMEFKVVDVVNGHIILHERDKNTYMSKKRTFTYDNFLYYLYHPTLFES